jgi:8-oxo-dGTP pyrophosphatase MutT (NUDIX family)
MPQSSPSPAPPRPSATVMVVRPQAKRYEVFMVRRHQASKFAADVYVFPGGTIRADDCLSEAEARALGLDPNALQAVLRQHADPFAEQDDGGLSLYVAALRELFEEAGLLLAGEADGRLLDLSDPAREAHFRGLRTELQEGRLSLAALARQEGLQLAADRLTYFSRWITPSMAPRRFDTRFFLAELPAGQTAGHCQIETTDGLWITPDEALRREQQGDFPLIFVTLEHVRRLAESEQIEALLAYAHDRSIQVVQPQFDERGQAYLTPEQQQW